MKLNFKMRLAIALSAALLFGVPAAMADPGGGHGGGKHGKNKDKYSSSRGYIFENRGFYRGDGGGYYAAPRYYAPQRSYYGGGFLAGRFYAGRGYFYGGNFWARPFFGVGIGIPFGYGYSTPRGCGYVDEFGDFYPAPCYATSGYDNRYGPDR